MPTPPVTSETASVDAPTRRSVEHWVFLVFAVVGLACFVVLGVFVTPDERGFGTHEKLGLPPCGMMEVLGVPCPGCGVTTSVSLAASGHFRESFVNQPFGFFFALSAAAYVVWAFVTHFRGRDLYDGIRGLRPGKWGIAIAVLLIGSWIYKILQT